MRGKTPTRVRDDPPSDRKARSRFPTRGHRPVIATPPPAAGTAKVVVTGKPWAEVWVDGVKLSADTPFTGTVAAGTRRFKFVQLGFTVERSITLKPGETVKISVNPSTGAVDVSR